MTLTWHRTVPVGLLLVLLPGTLTANAQDTTLVDSTLVDMMTAPDVVDTSDMRVPVPEPAVSAGPLPRLSRFSFDRDGMLWSGAETLSDLLTAIPGVYIARSGFLGQPEYVAYGGRGGNAVELYWDGLPLYPLGGDSLFVELSRIRLSYLDRVDVEVLPSTLRIHLVSTRHSGLDPRSMIQVTAGAFETSVFAGLFQKRWPSGLGLNLAADFIGTEGASGPGRNDQSFDGWVRLDWLPTPRTGATYQVRRQRQDRDLAENVPERKGARTDFLFSLFTGTRDDGLGLRAEGGLAASTWTDDDSIPDQRIRQAHLSLQFRRPNLTFQVGGRLGDGRINAEGDARFGWVPVPGIILSGAGRWRRHEFDRRSIDAHGSVGLFGGPFTVTGTVEYRDGLQVPAFRTDSTQRTVNASIIAGIALPVLKANVALTRREAYLPLPYPDLALIARFDSSAEATYVVADVALNTSRALSFHGWYSSPVRGRAADLQPPKHGRVAVSFRSKFLRTFRSTAFDFKVRVAMESWSTGPAGFDAAGGPLTLAGATFYDAFIQFQLVRFTLFWNFRNGYNSTIPYVPGYVYPLAVQTFGVKWEFAN